MIARTTASDHPVLSICARICERALNSSGAERTVGPAEFDLRYVEVAQSNYKANVSTVA